MSNFYTCRFAANFLCRGNRQIDTLLPRQKRQSRNTKTDLFLGLFQSIKCTYLLSFSSYFFQLSTRPHIQLEMGLKSADFGLISSQKYIKTFWYQKVPWFYPNLARNWPILGPIFAVFAVFFCRGKWHV